MSQQQVADSVGEGSCSHQRVVSLWERGVLTPEPKPVDIARLEQVLRLDAGELSQYLGWVPTGGRAWSVERAVREDDTLNDQAKRALLAVIAAVRQ